MVLAGNRWTPLVPFAVTDAFTGLASHWRMDEASGARANWYGASSLSDNNTVTQANGPVGVGAALFTRANSEYLSAAHAADLDLNGVSYAWAGWVYFTSTANAEEFVFDKVGASGGAQLRKLNAGSNGLLEFTHKDAAGTTTFVRTQTGQFDTAGVWQFVFCGFDMVGQTAFIQASTTAGALAAMVSSSPGVLPAGADTSTLYFGCEDAASHFLGGRLVNWSLWTGRVFSAGQIAEQFNGGYPLLYPFSYLPADVPGVQQVTNPHQFGFVGSGVFWLYDLTPNNSQPNWCSPGSTSFAVHFANGLTSITEKMRVDGEVPLTWSTTLGARPAYLTLSDDGDPNDKEAGNKDYVFQDPGVFTCALWFRLDANNVDQVLMDCCNWESTRPGFTLSVTSAGKLRFNVSRSAPADWGVDVTSTFTVPALTDVMVAVRSDGSSVDLAVFNPATSGPSALTTEDDAATFSGTRWTTTAYSTVVYGNRVSGTTYQVDGRLYDTYFFRGVVLSDAALRKLGRYKPGLVRNPTAVAGMSAWWDPADWYRVYTTSAKTTNSDPSGVIGALENSLAAGTFDLLQSGADAAKPTIEQDTTRAGYSYGVAVFDGTTDFLTADALAAQVTGTDQPFTLVFSLLRNASGSGTRTLFSFASSSGTGKHEIVLDASHRIASVRTDDGNTTVTVTATSTIPAYNSGEIPAVVSVLFTGTACTIRVDGTAEANGVSQNVGAVTVDQFTAGCLRASSNSQFASFALFDAFFDNAVLSANQVAYLEQFITQKHTAQVHQDEPAIFSGPPE